MEKQKNFILDFLHKEAECWTKRSLGNVDEYNNCVQELYGMAIDNLNEAFGIVQKRKFRDQAAQINYSLGHLFKISCYKNSIYGELWVAYVTYKNPPIEHSKSPINRGFFISMVNDELKIVGMMSVALRDSDLQPIGWDKSVYNPPELDINNLGEFILAERYQEPLDDGFSRQDYLKDK